MITTAWLHNRRAEVWNWSAVQNIFINVKHLSLSADKVWDSIPLPKVQKLVLSTPRYLDLCVRHVLHCVFNLGFVFVTKSFAWVLGHALLWNNMLTENLFIFINHLTCKRNWETAHQCYTENKKWSVIQDGKNFSGNARVYCHISWGWEVVMCGHAQREKVNKLSGFQWISCSTGQVLHSGWRRTVFFWAYLKTQDSFTHNTHKQTYTHTVMRTQTPSFLLCSSAGSRYPSLAHFQLWGYEGTGLNSQWSFCSAVCSCNFPYYHTALPQSDCLLVSLLVCPIQAKCPSHPSFFCKNTITAAQQCRETRWVKSSTNDFLNPNSSVPLV